MQKKLASFHALWQLALLLPVLLLQRASRALSHIPTTDHPDHPPGYSRRRTESVAKSYSRTIAPSPAPEREPEPEFEPKTEARTRRGNANAGSPPRVSSEHRAPLTSGNGVTLPDIAAPDLRAPMATEASLTARVTELRRQLQQERTSP